MMETFGRVARTVRTPARSEVYLGHFYFATLGHYHFALTCQCALMSRLNRNVNALLHNLEKYMLYFYRIHRMAQLVVGLILIIVVSMKRLYL